MTRVHIEFHRVQTWLFSVPRLRAMVGANTLLGEALRIQLPELARKQSKWQLAKEIGYPSASTDDPLSADDNPASDAERGIVARDGGHFEAIFAFGAEEFADAAAALLRRTLSGIRFQISLNGEKREVASVDLSTELPVLAPCQWTGRGLGSVTIRQGTELHWVSLDVSRRHKAAKRANDGNAKDLATLILAKTSLKNLGRSGTFEGLAGGSYLALIHADGNGVGGSAPSENALRAAFFHRNRVLLRRALQIAIEAPRTDFASGNAEVAPLQPLMLGGDDLLVVCRATTALPFAVALCEALEGLQHYNAPGFRLTLGIGIVFARPTIPIHRLHEIAEWLADSAKRRFRGFSAAERRSVADWAVFTTAWLDNPEEVRRRDWVCGTGKNVRVLSRRPVDVLGDGLDSLKGLLRRADQLKTAPRSQLRYLVEQLPKGQVLSELAFCELPHEARMALENAGVERVWDDSGEGPALTSLLDLIEVLEIGRLGRTQKIADGPISEHDGADGAGAAS